MADVLSSYTDDHTLNPLEWHRRSLEWCREMRAQEPISKSEEYGWLVFPYQEAIQVYTDYANYSSEYERSASEAQEEARSIITMDPPRHQHLRSILTQAFSARKIAQMEPQIQKIADTLLEKISAHGQADFMEELAFPLPVIVIAEMLGLPGEDWPLFKQWTDAQVHNDRNNGSAQELTEYFFKSVEQRRHQSDQSLISLLLNAEVDGQHLTPAELFSFFLTLLVAGNVTTTNLLGNAMMTFSLFPGALAQLRQKPTQITSAIEEILRYMGPARVLPHNLIGSRIAQTDIELAGHHIHKGDVVRPIVLSANFDERQFNEPEQFKIDRNPNRHFSFGHGIHFCLGAPLARLEARVVLTAMLKRFSAWEIQERDQLQQIDTDLIFGVKNLPMTFQSA
jgi:cytochrome P450